MTEENPKDFISILDSMFAEEPVQERKGKVHYLRFDDTPIKLASGETIKASVEGWTEICTMLRANDNKTMVRRLIALAIYYNRRKLQKQETTKQEEKPAEEKPEGKPKGKET